MSTTLVKQACQDEHVAQDHDREHLGHAAGPLFDRLEKRTLRKAVRQAVRDLPSPRVLDVPCGAGRITELLLEEGLSATGGDISEQAIDVAREKLSRFGEKAAFLRLDLVALDLPKDSFDVVTCIRLFHQLDTTERAAVLKELSRVSRRYVIINVSYSSPYSRFCRQVKRCLGQGVSRTCSTWPQLLREATAADLTVRSCRFVLPGVSEDMVVLLEKMSW